MRSRRLGLVCFALAASACATSTGTHDGLVDGRDDRADNLDQFTSCQTAAVLALVNDPSTTADRLVGEGIHSRAADNVIARRDGEDRQPGTADDFVFTSLLELDDVPWVGPVAMDAFLVVGERQCAGESGDGDGDCAVQAVLDWTSDPGTSKDDLVDAGVYSRAAAEIVAYRNGADGLAGTADDEVFETLEELDGVPQVGPTTLQQLLAEGGRRCGPSAGVIMSPQAYDQSHLARVVEEIDGAERSIDVAMYSFRDSAVSSALQRAVGRGVSVRFVYDGASADRLDPEGTTSARLEEMGIEVRWVNKIMHHKFAIIDGPRDDASAARTATLINGSGNWSNGAATRFDENTVFLKGDERLVLLYQREYDLLWENSRDFVSNETIAPIHSSLVITDEMIDAAPGSDAVFTSANFRTYDSATYGPTFAKVSGRYVGSDTLATLIASATRSIRVASGHMRSRAVAEALLAKHAADPSVDIRVYLDGQEYVSDWYYQQDVDDYEDCLAAASTASAEQACRDAGVYFGNALEAAGIDVRYKYYAYRWDYTYADQMHHKYIVIDDEVVASGSYNFSNNAELDTLENIAIYQAADYPELVVSYAENFDAIWQTGRDAGLYDDLLDEVRTTTGDFPIVFTPMALSWDEVTTLKGAIRDACPAVDTEAYRADPASHRWCDR